METKGKGFGAIRGYAGGGLIAGLIKGMLGMKTETVTEKFDRQDAEFRAKHPQPAAPASAPAQAPTQGNTAIGDYVGMTALQKREKAAGLKAGGMIKKKCVEGGEIEGPGGPTDDLVPIMASNGEFMIKASSAKILGPELLEALNDVGGKEEPKKGDKLKGGGMIRKMYKGGPVDDEKRRAEQLSQIPAGGTAPAPDGLSTGNDFTRNVNNSLNALGGMGVVASVPLKAAQAGQGAIRNAMNAPPVLQNMIPRLAAPSAQAAPSFIAGASGVAKVGGANLPSVITNTQIPIAKATNVALQEGAKANQMAAATRSLGNTSAGLGMLDSQQQYPVQSQTATSAGVGAGQGVGVDSVAARSVNPWATTQPTPSDVSGNSEAIAATEAQKRTSGQQGVAYNLNDPASNASILAQNPAGAVRRVGNSYSGANVSGNVGFVGADGNPISGRPGGGLIQGIAQSQATPDGSQWSSGDNAIMAANIRDGIDPTRGTSRGTPGGASIIGGPAIPGGDPNDLLSANHEAMRRANIAATRSGYRPEDKAMRAAGVGLIAGLGQQFGLARQDQQANARTAMTTQAQQAQTDAASRNQAANNQIAQAQLGLNRQKQTQDNALARDKMAADTGMEKIKQQLWAAYTTGTPEQKAQAAEQLQMMNGKDQSGSRPFAVPGGQGFNADGTPYTIASSVFDPSTKQFIQQGGQSAPKAPPKAGDTVSGYKFKGGNPADQKNWEKV